MLKLRDFFSSEKAASLKLRSRALSSPTKIIKVREVSFWHNLLSPPRGPCVNGGILVHLALNHMRNLTMYSELY